MRGKTVAIVGDSHMEALGPRLRRDLLARGARVLLVEARRGWSTARYVARRDVTIPPADIVVVELGGNDRPTTESSYASTIRAFLEMVPQRSKVIWVGPAVEATDRVDHDRVAVLQRRILGRLGKTWWDARPMTSVADLRSDRLHFTARGYDAWATKLSDRLDSSGLGPIVLAAGALVLVAGIFIATVRGPQ